jgi:hypothetical protein
MGKTQTKTSQNSKGLVTSYGGGVSARGGGGGTQVRVGSSLQHAETAPTSTGASVDRQAVLGGLERQLTAMLVITLQHVLPTILK